MIVIRTGYLSDKEVLEMKDFSIYETNKDTYVLVQNVHEKEVQLYYVKEDRLPWKITEGRKIARGKKIFDSKTDSMQNIDFSKWNSKQIMSYKQHEI